jgi:threonine/homoserine/homoserine lactone efflux protein
MAMSLFVAFWAVSVLFVITPGVDWAYSISAGINGRRVVPAVAGLLSGHLLATLVVAAGAGSAISAHPNLLRFLSVAGAGYLLWLGLGVLRSPSVLAARDMQNHRSDTGWALKGLLISGLNPKVFLLFLALLPQFTDPHASWPLSVQMAMLGLVHVASCGVVYLLVGYSSAWLLKARPGVALRVSQLSGALMIMIALLLLAQQLIGEIRHA